jgi:hypothetical protein
MPKDDVRHNPPRIYPPFDPPQWRRRRLLAGLAGSGALAMAGMPGRGLSQALPAVTQGLRTVQGEVRINNLIATAGALVRAGDTVVTGSGALAAFVVGQDAFLMRGDSHAELSGIDLALNGLKLVAGKLLGVFGPGAGKRLVTSSAIIGIRGTGAYLEAEDVRTYFCLCYGSAEIATTAGDARDAYTTTRHESPRYIWGDRREQPIVPADVANHSDDELLMLEALVGRTPPQEFMNSPNRYERK